MQIAIVGAGFSGVATTIQLLHRLPPGSRLELINSTGLMARGMAYGTSSQDHLLNVPAARMDLGAPQSPSFIEWLGTNAPNLAALPHCFAPRRLYGDYLHDCLVQAIAARPDLITVQRRGMALSLTHRAGGGFKLRLASGEQLGADKLILALGNFAPRPPHPALLALPGPIYVNDPWSTSWAEGLRQDAPVLLVGTGLTMLDMAVNLQRRGHTGQILALSRRGLAPQSHRLNELPPASWQPPADWLNSPQPLRRRLRQFRALLESARRGGSDWRDLWGGLRQHTPALWQQLSLRERAQFLRHLQVYWDIHRHRAAPEAHQVLAELQSRGQLEQRAGRIVAVELADGLARVQWRARRDQALEEFGAARVINCSGPSSRISSETSPLLAQLHAEGLLQPCPLGLGLHVDERYRVLDASAEPQQGLFYIGPLLKSQRWEATAVPELREHARLLAEACLSGA